MDDILKNAKLLLGITDGSKDDILGLQIEMTIQDILNYTNRNELPEQLRLTAAKMVRLAMIGALGADFKAPVSSLSEAGRSVSFATAQMTESAIEIERKDIFTQLNRFKLLFRHD